MEGIPCSFNPWTVLDSNDPGDVVGKAKTKGKEDAAATKKPGAGSSWAAASKAMEASTPSKKSKKKMPGSGNGPAAKQNGAGKGSKQKGS